MSRKTNEELRCMSIHDLEKYVESHPAEARRISKILATLSAKMFRVSIKYNVSGNLKPMEERGIIKKSYLFVIRRTIYK